MADKTANEQFYDALVRHQVYLLRYSGYVRNRIIGLLNATEPRIAELIRARLEGRSTLATPSDYKRMEALVASIAAMRSAAWKDVYKVWAEEMVDLSKSEVTSTQLALTTAAPVVVQVAVPAANQLRSIALSRPFQGRILKGWASSMQADDLARIQNAIQQGMTAGMSSRAIARLVVGTAQVEGIDGITQLTRNQVAAITRTAVAAVSSNAREEFISENADLFDQEQFVATLDSRTTPVCRANDGKRFPVGEGPRPPLHYQCRSLRVAVIGEGPMGERPAKPVTERMLLREWAEKNQLDKVPTSRDQLQRGTKGEYDKWARARVRQLTGTVPAKTTYQTWLKGQSVEFQNDVLGITRAKLFRDGGLQLDQFVNRAGDQINLKDLARKEASAFRAAGLNPDDY